MNQGKSPVCDQRAVDGPVSTHLEALDIEAEENRKEPSGSGYGPDSELDVFPEGGTAAWCVTLGSFLGLFSGFGLVNSVGAIQAYVQQHQLSHYSEGRTSWIFSMYSFVSFALSILCGPVFDVFGPYYLCVVGSVMLVAGLMLTSLCVQYYQFMFAFGLCCGIGTSLLITPCISIISHWFDNKRGLATGLASTGGSLGGVVFPIMLRALYENPNLGYGWAIRTLGFICLAASMGAIFLIQPREGYYKTHKQHTDKSRLKPQRLLNFGLLLRDQPMLLLTAGIFLCEVSILGGITYLPSFCLSKGMTTGNSYLMLALVNASGGVGRICSGLMADRVGRFNTLTLSIVLAMASTFGLWVPLGSHLSAMIAFSLLYGYATGAIMSLTPVCVGQISPTNEYGMRYGTLYFFCSFAMLFGIPVLGVLVFQEQDGPPYFNNVVLVIGGCYAGALLLILLTRYQLAGCRWIKV